MRWIDAFGPLEEALEVVLAQEAQKETQNGESSSENIDPTYGPDKLVEGKFFGCSAANAMEKPGETTITRPKNVMTSLYNMRPRTIDIRPSDSNTWMVSNILPHTVTVTTA